MLLDEIISFIMDLPGIIVGIFTKGMHTIIAGLMPLFIMAFILWIILKYLSKPEKTEPSLLEEEGSEP
ncbi:MAG: hypothetical protein HQL68_00185 [Magnetococcales bacterium]|nr:hypothetical protein [Magnetococcales bacterium]